MIGSSPDLWDDMQADPELAKRLYNAIPDISSRENEPRYLGDLAKVEGVVHIWDGSEWVRWDVMRDRTYNIEIAP